MARAPKCRFCKQVHWGLCRPPAINRPKERLTDAINPSDSAINRVGVNRTGDVRVGSDLGEETARPQAEKASLRRNGRARTASSQEASQPSAAKTPNRRKRQDYNAYMKDYMRRRRA